jgi:hypothetical protein
MSIMMARWKCATAPATAFRRWKVSRRRAVAEAQPSAELIVDPGFGARCATRDTGAPGPGRYHWTVTVCEETGPATEGGTGELAEARSRAEGGARTGAPLPSSSVALSDPTLRMLARVVPAIER